MLCYAMLTLQVIRLITNITRFASVRHECCWHIDSVWSATTGSTIDHRHFPLVCHRSVIFHCQCMATQQIFKCACVLRVACVLALLSNDIVTHSDSITLLASDCQFHFRQHLSHPCHQEREQQLVSRRLLVQHQQTHRYMHLVIVGQ
jgi:hypothetical protein